MSIIFRTFAPQNDANKKFETNEHDIYCTTYTDDPDVRLGFDTQA